MTSPAEYEAARSAFFNDNILEERWTHFSLEGVKFPNSDPANKRVSFRFQQMSSTMPITNPSPTEIVELHHCGSDSCAACYDCGGSRASPRVAAAAVKAKRKR